MKHKCLCDSQQRFKVGATSKIVAKRRAALVASIEELLLPPASYVVGLTESWKHRMSGAPLETVITNSAGLVFSKQLGHVKREFVEEQYIKQ
jgi:hypothetical protein